MAEKKAAIPADRFDDIPLEKLSTDDFLEALRANHAFEIMRFWPEKKKYELELGPGDAVGRIRFRDFVEILQAIKNEKKKVELEIPHWWRWVVDPDPQPRINPELQPWRNPDPTPWRSLAAHLDELATKLDQLTARVESLPGK